MQVRIENLTIGNGNVIKHISDYGEVREIVINAEHDKVEAVAVFSFVEESPELLAQLITMLNSYQEQTRIEQLRPTKGKPEEGGLTSESSLPRNDDETGG